MGQIQGQIGMTLMFGFATWKCLIVAEDKPPSVTSSTGRLATSQYAHAHPHLANAYPNHYRKMSKYFCVHFGPLVNQYAVPVWIDNNCIQFLQSSIFLTVYILGLDSTELHNARFCPKTFGNVA